LEASELSPDALFRQYAPYVAKIAHQLLGRDDEVDDVIQDVFLAAVRGVHQVREPERIRGWLAAVTVRKARRRLRARRVLHFFGADPPHEYHTVVDASASPEQRALMARVYKILDRLPADDRIAWALRYVEGQKLEQVAELVDCSLATAKRRIARAQALLEEAFRDE
jgi:RNA polymerase sigma-70 factor, ECF subfamily